MPEERLPPNAPEEYEETVHPANPPSAVLHPEVRRNALWVYVGPIVIVAVVLAVAFLYWASRDEVPVEPVAPTSGYSQEPEATPGGGSPAPRPESTQEELEFRGR